MHLAFFGLGIVLSLVIGILLGFSIGLVAKRIDLAPALFLLVSMLAISYVTYLAFRVTLFNLPSSLTTLDSVWHLAVYIAAWLLGTVGVMATHSRWI